MKERISQSMDEQLNEDVANFSCRFAEDGTR